MNSRHSSRFLLLAALALVAGCSTVYEGKYEFAQGWRKARVVQVIQGAQVTRPNYWQCLREVPVEARSTRLYALLAYTGFGRARQRLMPVPSGLELHEQEVVYVNLARCEDAVVKPLVVNR